MTHLGKFGAPREAATSVFDYFDVTLRVNPDLTDVAVIDLFGSLGDGANVAAGLRAIGSTLVHPDDVEEFWRLAKANRQTMEDLAGLAMALVAAIADRPTRLPSGFSGGQSTTGTRSEDGSYSAASIEARLSGSDDYTRALEMLDGRPDLQQAVVRARRDRQAQQGAG